MPAERPATATDPASADSGSVRPFSTERPFLLPGAPPRLPRAPRWWRQWSAHGVDGLIAVCCGWFDSAFRNNFAETDLHSPLPPAAYSALAMLAAATLLVRRRLPVLVTALITLGLLLGTPSVLTIVVAYYSLARHARRIRIALPVAAGGLCVVIGAALLHLRHYAPHHGTTLAQQILLLICAALAAVVLPLLIGMYPRLPRQPFWWAHRRDMLFDALLVLVFPAANPGEILVAANEANARWFLLPVPVIAALGILQAVALLWRRRYPAAVAASSVLLVPLVLPLFSTLPVCLYSLAKYGRSRRVLLLASVAAVPMVTASVLFLERAEAQEQLATVVFVVAFTVLVPVSLGMYAGARRGLMESLRERATRLERERDLLATQARLEERARIAREMHDVVSHRVSLIVVHAGALEVSLGGNESAARTAQLIGDTGRQALDELRQAIGVLRLNDGGDAEGGGTQPTLDELETLVDGSRAAGLPVTLDVAGDRRRLDVRVERAAYRVVQEALTNVHKHAGNAATRVELRYLPDAVRVTVQNEAPAGPSPARLPSGGHGLAGLGERIGVLGGALDTGPVPDAGFRVTATIPAGDSD
jgi:signal transduction histidine kinase